MLIKKMILSLGLSFLLTACATGRYTSSTESVPGETNTDLGVRYLLGRGVLQNNEKAFYYFSKAANEDDPFAENEVAYLYAAGKGTAPNFTKAFVYYQKAAKHGLASAQYNLGLLYLHGLGTPENKTAGMQWIKKAATHGFEPAKKMLTMSASSS